MKYIILDFDGTIGDTQALIVRILQQTMAQMGLSVQPAEDCAKTIGLRLEEAFRVLHPQLTLAQAQHCATAYRDIFEKNKQHMIISAFPHVVETLAQLYAQGMVLAVASSRNRASLQGYLDQLHIADYISCVVAAEDVVHTKPAPDMVLKVLETVHGTVDDTLVVGDMSYDIEMGRNAGAKTCGVTYGNGTRDQLAQADYVINDFADVLRIVSPSIVPARLTKAQVKWVRSLQNKKERDGQGVFVAEGEKCVNEMCKAFPLVLLATTDNATATEIEQISSLRTPQGVIGVFRKEPISVPTTDRRDGGLLLALDGVQDPGNLGTIIRTCDWFGVRNIYCSHDTADCFNPKVVQATMGALARVRVHYVDLVAELQALGKQGVPIYGTLLNGRDMYERGAIEDKAHGIIVMGNEGNGISMAVRPLVTHPLLIPSYPAGEATSESLNVGIATAITLAEFRRPDNILNI